MMPAEKWYKYQESYMKYGPDMKPHKDKKSKQNKKNIEFSGKDKLRISMLIICVGIVCVGLIVATAYAASLKFEINRMIMANNDIEGEIQNLNVNLQKNTNISAIEEKAINELGMAYALPEQIQYIEPQKDVKSDFASILKEEAYN
ncbi:MAG: cell division protein FtsL [Eubacteriales bacterium]|nr:cell division protein FtsL [Eubacteriales bacterium]MDD4389897.1 cell division protein FtsL [Eubacteriales bacterium]